MTENEAIKAIQNDLEWHSKELKPTYKQCLRLAIQALEEIKQYRAIGTIEKFKALKNKHIGKDNMVISSSDLMTILNSDSEELKSLKDENAYLHSELQAIGATADMFEKEIRNKAIDEFAERIKRFVDCGHLCSPTEIRWSDLSIVEMIDRIAEQLKGGAV